ncbi:MAG: ComEC/Rec2 family competence protein [Myxococcota bacterium]
MPWTAAISGFLRANLTFDDPTVTALHRALVLGDRTELPPELRWAYQDTGLAHLLAISGFNLAVLGWGLFKLVRWLCLRIPRVAQGGRPSAWAAALALALVAVYTAVILPSDATDRAMLGMGIALGAVIVGRRARGWRTISVCFLVALAIEPAALMRPSFQLTLAATAALIGAGPLVRVEAWLEVPGRLASPWLRAAPGLLGAVVIADLATFFATAPLGLCWFG